MIVKIIFLQKFGFGMISSPLDAKPDIQYSSLIKLQKGANRVTPHSWPQKKGLAIIFSEVANKQRSHKEKYL